MLVEHSLTVVGRCPVDGCPDVYEVTVRTGDCIRVEDILLAVKVLTKEPRMQEDFTEELHKMLAVRNQVETVGFHSGVKTRVLEGTMDAAEFAVTMNGLFWNADIKSFTSVPTRYPTPDEAAEAAQEDAKLPPGAGWNVVPVN